MLAADADTAIRPDPPFTASRMSTLAAPQIAFDAADVHARLDALTTEELDLLDFGVISFAADGTVVRYNRFESQRAGMATERVLGRHFFTEVAPCTNNFMVATRFEEEPTLDATIPYVFTFRMRPTQVELRLLQAPGAAHAYILVRPR